MREQTCTMAPPTAVAGKQSVSGGQSAFDAQPGTHTSPAAGIVRHALAKPSALVPPGPRPEHAVLAVLAVQSTEHQPSVHVSPVAHPLALPVQGSPMPDSLHTAHFPSRHVSSSLNVARAPKYDPHSLLTHVARPPHDSSHM